MFTEEAFALGTQDYRALWSRVMKFITYEGAIEPVYSFVSSMFLLSVFSVDSLNVQNKHYVMLLC